LQGHDPSVVNNITVNAASGDPDKIATTASRRIASAMSEINVP
jgi:hypothetical protein